jgi:hypothetical protein
MNNGRPALVLLVACFLLLVPLGSIFAQENNGVFDLAITTIETEPFAAGIGDETNYSITLENLHSSVLPTDLFIDLVLTVANAQNEEVIAQCRQPVNLALVDGSSAPMRLAIDNCNVILKNPGTHLVRAELIPSGKETSQGAFSAIPGDLNPSNNGNSTTIIPVINEGDENLPTELTRIFAGLAIFFAVMALVAVGTEVAIDTLKVAIGMKRKVTSMEALDRMEKYLPGELGALSVSATTQEEFRRMIREIRRILGETLQGIESFAALREQIIGSEFGRAFLRADQIGRSQESLSSKELYNYKKYLQAYVTNVLNTLQNRLQTPFVTIRPLRDQLAQEISLFDGEYPDAFLSRLIGDLQDTHFWATQIVDGWFSNKKDTFLNQDSDAIIEEFNDELEPILLGVGFKPVSIESLKQKIVSSIGVVEAGMSQSTDTFLDSVRNVLDAVELRRYDTQSPSRKVWRKLRGWKGGTFPPTRLRSTLMPAFYLALFFLFLAWVRHLTDSPPFGSSFLSDWHGYPLSWFLLFFVLAFAAVLGLYYGQRSFGRKDKLWFIGLYGATMLSFLSGLVLTLLIWVLQPISINRVTGELKFFDWIQPWWSWLIIFSLIILLFLMVTSLIAKYVYDRLMRSAVRDRRMSPADSSLENTTVIHRVETLWNLLRQGFDVTKVEPDHFDKPDTVTEYEEGKLSNEEQPFYFSPETAAKFIMQRSDQQRDEETSRLRILRVLSIAVGLVIAYLLQIDVLDLLGEAFPDILDKLNWTIVSGQTLHAWRSWLPADKSISVGIVLTAFAASAGSAFWHDRLDQLQAAKKGTQAAAQFLNQASQIADSTRRNN